MHSRLLAARALHRSSVRAASAFIPAQDALRHPRPRRLVRKARQWPAHWKQGEIEAAEPLPKNYLSDIHARAAKHSTPWKVLVSAFVERMPRALPPLAPWQQELSKLQDDLKVARAPSEHRDHVRAVIDASNHATLEQKRRLALRLRDNDDLVPYDADTLDTVFDERGDTTSIHRRLTDFLYLVVRRPSDGGADWFFPTTPLGENETLRDAAVRCVQDSFPQNEDGVWVMAHQPCGHLAYELSEQQQEEVGAFGLKVMLYKCQAIDANIDHVAIDGSKTEHQWLAREELPSVFPRHAGAYVHDIARDAYLSMGVAYGGDVALRPPHARPGANVSAQQA